MTHSHDISHLYTLGPKWSKITMIEEIAERYCLCIRSGFLHEEIEKRSRDKLSCAWTEALAVMCEKENALPCRLSACWKCVFSTKNLFCFQQLIFQKIEGDPASICPQVIDHLQLNRVFLHPTDWERFCEKDNEQLFPRLFISMMSPTCRL